MFRKKMSAQYTRFRGFTLVELLVVVSIIVLLTTITVVSINFSFSRDRVRAAARQVQSFVAGARDRAIHSKEPRGVRFLLSPNDRHVVTAMQYVGAPERWLLQCQLTSPSNLKFPSSSTAASLESVSLLAVGSQIEIPSGSGTFLTIASRSHTDSQTVTLSSSSAAYSGAPTNVTCSLILPSSPIPGAEPVELPPGVAIDLDGSRIPQSWRPASTNSTNDYSHRMDVMFNPRGNLIGDAAGFGLNHLLLADIGDIAQWRNITGRVQAVNPSSAQWSPPAVPVNPSSGPMIVKRDQMIVSINGRTGTVGVYAVDVTPSASGTNVALHPYQFAETGQVAK
ncbi:prepilin-type N-terminal cleavage/methylation domain-containing protein [Schlesneria paludicola]|uniref:prepilin-type N-terminal cleavage/methylation domain-containing protein n=1 Tax=Schlesneria paludicola TaxID=360056 RepID=UPI0002EAB9CA